MAYQGYLLKMNGIAIPHKYMAHDTYNVIVNTQDVDSYQDANGELHRTVLEHSQIKIEWNFPFATNVFLQELLGIFRNIWGDAKERKCECTVYVPEWDSYYSGTFYMPDTKFNVYSVGNGVIKYRATRFALIEY
mgnify:CR=1 FL=1